ncbi:MAG TPA: MSEP-CTERM sorting domain-containing protein [Leptospiraceae bacterium]|nr:MSEP-CTERM sorting domain-containing protein [Leptospiraceae bacterium]HMW05916.1 MSEP-CTERM sorting domain-containing protein [Leptospiraceae bacterium]HMX32693.1 MSEP-CTERM sorting domain-containing protein [Leptospiraceae bacterium]HMY32719.1 MSEP-CTERM sorting domain-containing protein [Leptospiraceae bacterium]HMZ62527.1 MSEP-CTERM sorting domain-containing protein [Leptospiraceae bacterium]
MRHLLNPKSIFFITTLPASILSLLMYGNFTLIQTLLEKNSIDLWIQFGIGLSILTILSTLSAILFLWRKLEANISYALYSLIGYTTLLYSYFYKFDSLIPISIPQWMIADEVFFYAGTFLMPTLLHSIFILVGKLTDNEKQGHVIKNFIYALLIPAIWYLFFQIILPLWKTENHARRDHVLFIFFIVGTILFLFFVTRWIYVLSLSKSHFIRRYELIWKIPFSVLFPLLGLAINNGFNPKSFEFNNYASGIFGDFNGFWFYVVAILNGLLICLPNLENKFYRYFLFFGRSFTFSYTFYFFLVFIPFLPFSIVGVIWFGLGFLLLTPLILMIIHSNELISDFEFLKNYFSKGQIIFTVCFGILLLPTFIHANFYLDKLNLKSALSYLYSPNYLKEYNLNIKSIYQTIEKIKIHKERNRGFFSFANNKTPYISSYFRWIVLDNLTLSDSKIQFMEKVLLGVNDTIDGSSIVERIEPNLISNNVIISKVKTKSEYNPDKQFWISKIDLEIKSNSTFFEDEYSTSFSLPIGSWISDYYLFVDGKKEKGILAEKKAATWIYSQIRQVRKDPGLLFYENSGRIQFRVFPFSRGQTRKTGFEIIHKIPIEFKLDGNTISLGKEKDINIYSDDKIIFIPNAIKQKLPTKRRNPYYHFLIDTSISNESDFEVLAQRIETFLSGKQELFSPKFSSVNLYTTSLDPKDWKSQLKKIKRNGGFFLERALRKSLFENYIANKNEFPIFIVVKNTNTKTIFENNLSNLQFTFPETDTYYELLEDGKLYSNSFLNIAERGMHNRNKLNIDFTVYEYSSDGITYSLPQRDSSEIILKKPSFPLSDLDIKEKTWSSGLWLEAKWMSHQLFPEDSEREWIELVKYSFISQIMTHSTSYIVLENEAQKEALRRKQAAILSANKSLDAGEETLRMSEPDFYLLFLLFLGYLFLKYFFKRRQFE